jgi:heme-degrading monooxygenase HmoA
VIQVVWKYVVKEEARGRFELAYGPGGAWSKLFARCPGFRGTTLLRDTADPRRYLTIDFWDSEAQRDEMLAEHAAEYAALDATFAEWTEAEEEVGVFSLLSQGTVHPVAAKRRGGAGQTRGGSRRTRR